MENGAYGDENSAIRLDVAMNQDALNEINSKLDLILDSLQAPKDTQRYLSARDVAGLTGLDPRTILNRSNLPRDHARYIPKPSTGWIASQVLRTKGDPSPLQAIVVRKYDSIGKKLSMLRRSPRR